jgi:hypothetical protein
LLGVGRECEGKKKKQRSSNYEDTRSIATIVLESQLRKSHQSAALPPQISEA